MFTRVPTDSGMCCALNADDSLRESEYKALIKEMQGERETTKRVMSRVGQKNGLRITLDLHSNTMSFGTHDKEYRGFHLFIGQPEEFPMMREKGVKLQPGSEHFIDL